MKIDQRVWFAALAALIPLAALAAPGDDERAEKAFREGIKLYQAGKMPDAEAKFEEAWALKKTADIAGNLGGAELEQQKWDEAANHLWYCDQNLPLSSPKAQKEAIKQQLAQAKEHVGELVISVEPARAEVSVDGKNVGVAPLAGPVFVLPGAHEVAAAVSGAAEKKSVEARAGVRSEVTITMAAVAPSASSATPSASVAPSASALPPQGKPAWPFVLAAGVGAVGLGVGIGTIVVASGKSSDATDLAASAACKPVTDACVAEGRALESDASTFSTVATVGFAVAGAASLAVILYAAIPAKRSNPPVALVPLVAPGFQGLVLGGAF